MYQGWFAFHRKTLESAVWTDPALFRLWMLCLAKASHKANDFLFDGSVIHLNQGEFVTGRKSLTDEYNQGLKASNKISESKTWRLLNKLKTNSVLNIKSTTKFSVISITNWNKYQNSEQQNEQQVNNGWTASEQRLNTNNNDNNNNNVNNKEISLLPPIDKNNINSEPEISEVDGVQKTKELYQLFEKEFGRHLSPIENESISKWIAEDNYDLDVIRLALREAVLNQAYSLKYIDRILLAWERKGIKSKQQAENAIVSRRNAKVTQQQPEPEEELPSISLHNWLNPEEDEE